MRRSSRHLITIAALLLSSLAHGTNWSTQTHDLYPGDFDGDGRDDMLVIAKAPDGLSGIFTSQSGEPSTQLQSWNNGFLGINWHSGNYTAILNDFNGDNHDDVLLQPASAGTNSGKSYLLLANGDGKLYGIHQEIANWDQTRYRIVSGDFDGNGRDDLFLQSRRASAASYVMLANAAGQFGSAVQTIPDNYLGFKWSTQSAVIHIGSFNADTRDDLLLQARPDFALIDLDDLSVPIPVYKPQSFGLMLADAAGMFVSIHQMWSRRDFGVDWSPAASDLVIGDFDGDGRDDVMLVARRSGQPSYIMLVAASGQLSTSSSQTLSPGALGTNWTAAEYRMFTADFNGDGRAELYRQAISSGGTNDIVSFAAGGSANSVVVHNAPSLTSGLANAIGATEGKLVVDGNGSAMYAVPIEFPKGTNGLKPAVSLQYTSLSGNGLLGVGWNIAGLSQIARCGRTLDQDNEIRAIELNANDRFCMDGNRLRTTNAGTYGADGTTYQTELDTISRVTSFAAGGGGYSPTSGPQYFRVEGRDGLYYYYGYTEDARIQVRGSLIPRSWLLSRVADRDGNYLTLTYQKGTDSGGNFDGSYRPLLIEWAHTAAGAGPYFKASFVYESRPDAQVNYYAGATITQSQRLDRIDVHAFEEGTWALQRRYDLTYEATLPNTELSRLASLRECTASECLTPTVFQYQNGTSGWNAFTQIPLLNAEKVLFTDLNYDGRQDVIYTLGGTWRFMLGASGGGFEPAVTSSVNDAGRDSAVAMDYFGIGRRQVLVPVGNQIHRIEWDSASNNLVRTNTTLLWSSGDQWRPGDIDGDGREDLVVVRKCPTVCVSVRYNTATGLSASETLLWQHESHDVIGQWKDERLERFWDFNGDGRADMLLFTNKNYCGSQCGTTERWRVLISNGTSLVQTDEFNALNTPPLVGDFNGDGLSDVVYIRGSAWMMRYGTGVGVTAEIIPNIAAPSLIGNAEDTIVADYDGDGRDDLLTKYSGAWNVMRATSTGFQNPQPLNGWSGGVFIPGDLNGDGLVDLFAPAASCGVVAACSFWSLHQGVRPDMMTSAVDGFGNSQSVTYSTLTDPTTYSLVGGGSYPQKELRIALPVVRTLASSTGIASPSSFTTTFTYAGFRTHLRGRGPLGFGRRTSVDGRSNIKTEEFFRQDFPHTGKLSSVNLRQPAGTLISSTSFEYATTVLSATPWNERRFSYTSSTTELRNEVGGPLNGQNHTRTTTVDNYDSYANLTARTVTVEELQLPLISNGTHRLEYTNTIDTIDTTNWCVTGITRGQVSARPRGQSALLTRTKAFVYDYPKCRPTQEIVEPDNPGGDTRAVKTIAYWDTGPSIGQVKSHAVTGVGTSATTPRVTQFEYHPAGPYVTKLTNPAGHYTESEWRIGLGVEKSRKDVNGHQTLWQHDSFGRVMLETRPDGTQASSIFFPCPTGCGLGNGKYQVVQVESGGGATIRQTASVFDTKNRELQATTWRFGGTQSHVLTEYDEYSRVKRRSAPLWTGGQVFWTTPTYDLVGRVIREERPVSETDGSTHTSIWSFRGPQVVYTDPKNRESTQFVNAIGQVYQARDAAGVDTSFVYDPFGNLKSATDPSGNVFSAGYNVRGFKTSTSDPNAGNWTYGYNSLGEMTSQTDANLRPTAMTYDVLGRMRTRTETEGSTTWTYDTAANGLGALHTVTTTANAYAASYSYDALSRISSTTTAVDGLNYLTTTGYNAQGQLATIEYPESYPVGYRLKVRHTYDFGTLRRIEDANTGSIVWTANDTNAAGAISAEQAGNGVVTSSWYDAITGELRERYAGPGYNGTIQSLGYKWDRTGNLERRSDGNQAGQCANEPAINRLCEEFVYDTVDRLDVSRLNGTINVDVSYDSLGNISSLTGAGSYTYHTTKKNAVVSTTAGYAFEYDSNGNMTRRNGNVIDWYSYNLPRVVRKGTSSSEFFYAPDRSRYKHISADADNSETTVYIGGLVERVTRMGGAIEYRHMVSGPEGLVAMLTRRSNGVHDTRYVHRDHVGSIDVLTNEAGSAVVRLSYDPMGKRRNAATWSGAPTGGDVTQINAATHRGFTGHETLDNVDLVHMNGRVYDPMVGRFISADPVVQNPFNLQALNRYSYVENNPLSNTDPTGLTLEQNFKKYLRIASIVIFSYGAGVSAAGAFEAGSLNAAVASGAAAGATSGGMQAAFNGGSLSDILKGAGLGGVTGAATAYLGYQIKEGFNNWRSEEAKVYVVTSGERGAIYTELAGTPPPGSKIFPNGILNDGQLAADNALKQAGEGAILFHNPTHGFIPDLVESALMKVTGTSSLGRQLAGLLESGNYSTLVAHSQGSLIASNALNTLKGQSFNFGGGLTVRYYGAAANRWIGRSLARAVGAVWGGVQNHPFDAVGNVIGLNTLNPFRFVGSILAVPTLPFSSISPHSHYP